MKNKIMIVIMILAFGLSFSSIGMQKYDEYCEQTPYADSIH